jgi:hypothetical protein
MTEVLIPQETEVLPELDEPRITPEDVQEAYDAMGYRPVSGLTLARMDGREVACGFGAVAMYRKKLEDPVGEYSLHCAMDSMNLIYGKAYMSGFFTGFDGIRDPDNVFDRGRFLQGYEDGRRARLDQISKGASL